MKKIVCLTSITCTLILLAISGIGCGNSVDKLNSDLIDAAERGEVPEGRRLLSKGASVNARVERGTSILIPLNVAARSGNVAFVEFLISEGADVNAVDKVAVNQSPLHHVADKYAWTGTNKDKKRAYLEIAKILVSKGADVNKAIKLQDSHLSSHTPLDMAFSYEAKSGDMIDYLVSVGGKVYVQDSAYEDYVWFQEKKSKDIGTGNSSTRTGALTLEQALAERRANETPAQRQERLLKADQWDLEERQRLQREQSSGGAPVMRTNPYRW